MSPERLLTVRTIPGSNIVKTLRSQKTFKNTKKVSRASVTFSNWDRSHIVKLISYGGKTKWLF